MTANQIAASGLEETFRHNVRTEDETERHNKATEAIGEQQNAINSMIAQTDADYKKKSLQLTEEYNATYLKLQEAQTNEKERYQRELNRIQDEQNRITESYNNSMVNLQQQSNDLKSQQNMETVRHNEAMEAVQARSNEIANKVAEYENTYKTEANRIADARLSIEMQKLRNDYELGLMNVEVKSASNLIAKEANELRERQVLLEEGLYGSKKQNIEADTKLKRSQRIQNYNPVKQFDFTNW